MLSRLLAVIRKFACLGVVCGGAVAVFVAVSWPWLRPNTNSETIAIPMMARIAFRRPLLTPCRGGGVGGELAGAGPTLGPVAPCEPAPREAPLNGACW